MGPPIRKGVAALARHLAPIWAARTRREQGLLAGLGLLLVAVILWEGVIRPVGAYRAGGLERLERARATLAEVDATARALSDLAAPRTRAADTPGADRAKADIRRVVGRTAQDMGVTLTRLRPDGSDRLTIWLDRVDAGLFHRWLLRLTDDHGLHLARLSLTAESGGTPEDAALTAQLVLSTESGGRP